MRVKFSVNVKVDLWVKFVGFWNPILSIVWVNDRLQCGDCGVQEHQLYCLGCGRSGQGTNPMFFCPQVMQLVLTFVTRYNKPCIALMFLSRIVDW